MTNTTERRPVAGTAENQKNSVAPDHNKNGQDSQSERRDPHSVQTGWLRQAIGRQVRARFLDGKSISGRLVAFDQFTVLIQTSADTPSLIFKHGIGCLVLDAQGDSEKTPTTVGG